MYFCFLNTQLTTTCVHQALMFFSFTVTIFRRFRFSDAYIRLYLNRRAKQRNWMPNKKKHLSFSSHLLTVCSSLAYHSCSVAHLERVYISIRVYICVWVARRLHILIFIMHLTFLFSFPKAFASFIGDVIQSHFLTNLLNCLKPILRHWLLLLFFFSLEIMKMYLQ